MANNDYKMPIYLQLREIIRNKIEDGEYMPGTAIPSENSLAQTFGINRITIRNAVDALVHEGLLRRVQGKGVFVVGKKSELSIEEKSRLDGAYTAALRAGGWKAFAMDLRCFFGTFRPVCTANGVLEGNPEHDEQKQ